VLQPAAWIETTQGKTLVLYSLGNALFDQGGLADTRRSALVMVTLDADGVTSVRIVPFEIDVVHSRVVQPDAETVEKIQDRLNLP
jgi:poly-gamma-glutamate capsule biosynthesis protein CapA/YwtB (metallophosphatase superfamily)